MIKLRKLKISYERGRQALLFLFCLFLAFILWSIHKLSGTYSVNLSYNVHVVTQKRGHAAEADAENKLSLNGSASGFYILQNRLGIKSAMITLPVKGIDIRPVLDSPDKFFIVVKEIDDVIADVLRTHLEIETFSTDTLFLTLPSQSHKDIPIAVDYTVRFKDQYMSVGKVKVSPATVTVYGNMAILDKTDSIHTQPMKFDKLSESLSGVTELFPIQGLRYTESEFYYSLDVVRYVEKSLLVPVEILNVPDNKLVRFYPNKVRAIYRIPFKSARSTENAIFAVTIDYNDITTSLSNSIEPKVSRASKDILSVEFEPKFIKCKVIEK